MSNILCIDEQGTRISFESVQAYKNALKEGFFPSYFEYRNSDGELNDFTLNSQKMPAIYSSLRCYSYTKGKHNCTITASGDVITIDEEGDADIASGKLNCEDYFKLLTKAD